MEEVYVVVELDGVPLPIAGEQLHLEGMDSPSPRLVLPDGTTLHGKFERTVGTQMVFRKETFEGEANSEATPHVKLVCHTDKKIVFRKDK